MGFHNSKYSSVNKKFKRKFNRAFETHPSSFFNDTVTGVQSRLGDEAARSLCRSLGGGNPGPGSLQAVADGYRKPIGFGGKRWSRSPIIYGPLRS